MNTGNATDINSGCQLNTADVSVALAPVLTAVKARPPRSLNTHIRTNKKVVNSTKRVSQVNHWGGGGPSGVLATPPSSYSSAITVQLFGAPSKLLALGYGTICRAFKLYKESPVLSHRDSHRCLCTVAV